MREIDSIYFLNGFHPQASPTPHRSKKWFLKGRKITIWAGY